MDAGRIDLLEEFDARLGDLETRELSEVSQWFNSHKQNEMERYRFFAEQLVRIQTILARGFAYVTSLQAKREIPPTRFIPAARRRSGEESAVASVSAQKMLRAQAVAAVRGG